MGLSAKNIVVGAAVAAAAVAAFCFLNPSEEGRVKAAFKRAAATVSKEADEPLLAIAAKVRAISDLAEPEIRLSVPERDLNAKFTRSEMAQHVMLARKSCSSLSVAFESVSVQSIDGDVARATADLLVSGIGAESFLQGRDTREVESVLKKSPEDGKWRFSSMTIKAIVTPGTVSHPH